MYMYLPCVLHVYMYMYMGCVCTNVFIDESSVHCEFNCSAKTRGIHYCTMSCSHCVCVCVSINIHWWCSIYIVLIIPIYCVLITATSFDGSKCTSYQIPNPFVRSKVVYT